MTEPTTEGTGERNEFLKSAPAGEGAKTEESTKEKEKEKETKKKKKKKDTGPQVVIRMSQRSKRKSTTTIVGLDLFEIKLNDASKACSKKFACSSSVVKTPEGKEEVLVQGDIQEDVADFLVATFNIPENAIVIEEPKKKK